MILLRRLVLTAVLLDLMFWSGPKFRDWWNEFWGTTWAYFWYQEASGYPPGELTHWFETEKMNA